MTPDQREAELRRRDARFRSLTMQGRVELSAQTYGHLADCSFLLQMIDGLRRVIAHAPTASLPALPEPGPALPEALRGAKPPPAPPIPTPPTRSDLPWSDPANQA